ncbi:uncharacterized protein LOC134280047 [Saccostrea cucullata]|uniref:uncharacterized protein LOC134280047 n=1 Tax=Saccostrea cuccullata TaxID=36930 RepID=UPI002ED1F236
MGRRDKKSDDTLFIHSNMYSIIPDIPKANSIQPREKIPSIPTKKLPSKSKQYEVLPHLGEFVPPSFCNNATRSAPCIELERLAEPTAKKLRPPLACLDVESIRKKIDKAEKKQKKAKKKKAKPPPKEVYVERENPMQQLMEQYIKMMPHEVHIPHPPLFPLDPTMLRRIVKIKTPTSVTELTIEQYVSLVTSGQDPFSAGDPSAYTSYANPEEFIGYPDPQTGGRLPDLGAYMDSFQGDGYMNPPDVYQDNINPDRYGNPEFPSVAGGKMPDIHKSRFAPKEMYGGGRFTANRDYRNQFNNASQKPSMSRNTISIDSRITV